MRNMTVSKKLIAGFLIVTAFSVLLAGLGIFSGLSTNANYTYLIEKPIEREMLLAEIQFQFTMMRYRAANFAMETGNPDIITGTLTPQYQSAYDAFTEALDAYLENNNADPRRAADIKTANADNASTLRTLADQFKRESDRVREIALSGDAAGATTALRDVIPITNEINALLGNMITPAAELVASESQNMDESAVIFTIVLAGTAFVCFVISMVLAVYIARLIAKPLKDMMGYIKQAGETGNLHFRDDEWANCDRLSAGRDEIGQTMKAFTAMMRKFVHYGEAVGQVAAQDLTLEVATLGDSDTFGNAIRQMVDNLNEMFGEIHSSTAQVNTGSKQIADGSQALAQGSTQQAAAIEQLSSSITEIAQKTKDNADMATKAANLAGTIKTNAEKGSRQMDEMMVAVKEINQASQSINKVIKVIDDIAFQTNILALNAAVEAARAGQHGKGFAVVAEEVRSLAAKSAEAAKDTGGLIANSMEKAELGSRIAGDTAASLVEIVSGINESSQIVTEIAKSSEEQSLGIAQINRGIDQVAQVVQQNSATAEESAAASEEMSGQANMLEELISQFKLKSTAQRRISSDGGFGRY